MPSVQETNHEGQNLMSMPSVKISTQALKAIGVLADNIQLYKEALQAACDKFEINTHNRVAMFLAQAAHESEGFKHIQENLFYSTPERIMQVFPSKVKTLEEAKKLTKDPKKLANCVYAGRLGNGEPATGNGWDYRGRGLFQLTGKDNYSAAAVELDFDYVSLPELLNSPKHGALTAAWYWKKNGCNELADQRQFSVITKRINGPAMLGHNERMQLYALAINALE